MANQDRQPDHVVQTATFSGDNPAQPEPQAQPSELAFALLSASDDCVKLFSTDGTLDFMSRSGMTAMEIADFADVKGKYWWSLWPEAETVKLRDAVARANAGLNTRFEAYCPTSLGKPKWWDVAVAPIHGSNGAPRQILALSRDITELRDRTEKLERALAESQILRREVDHRVKNSLGIVSSLLNIQARAPMNADAVDALLAAAVRVRTIATVHDRLYHSKDLGDLRLDDYLRLLCTDVAASVGEAADIRCDPDLASLVVSPDAMVSFGLIVAELIGNAVRHGPKGRDPVQINIALQQVAPTLAKLQVSDNGLGLPVGFDPGTSRGIGMQVMLSMAQKIGGRFSFDRAAIGGALVRLDFDPTTLR